MSAQHFELLPESSLTTAQSALASELQPEVFTLLARVETYLDKLERREQSLIAKAELQEGRLSRTDTGRESGAGKRAGSGAPAGGGELSALEQAKMQQLRQKKERLSYAVSRLELQAGQRERQLRKSMAAQ